MVNVSQQELVKLGQEALENKHFPQAESYFTEAISFAPDLEIEKMLVQTLLVEKKQEAAFEIASSWQNIFDNVGYLKLYVEVLQENRLNIEWQKLNKKFADDNASEIKKWLATVDFSELDLEEQKKIYQDLNDKLTKDHPLTRHDLYRLQKLSQNSYLQLIKSALVNPYLTSNNRTILIEELNDFSFDDEVTIIYRDVLTTINPQEVGYFFNDQVISQGLKIIEDDFEKDPTFEQLVKMSFLQIMQELFPFVEDSIVDVATFVTVLADYLKNGQFSEKSAGQEDIQKIITENLS